jgi:hypothetical protein
VNTPIPETRCPLCGADNRCAPASSGSFDTPCWCTGVRIDAAVLERIPAEARGVACLCERCARGAGTGFTAGAASTAARAG